MYMSFDEKDTTDASSSCFSIVPLFHQPTLPSCFSTPVHTYFWMPANLPSLGQEPRQTLSASCPWPGACWEPLRFLLGSLCPSRLCCFLLGTSWAECNSPYRARHWISINVSWMSSLLVGRREPFRERTSSLGVCGSKIHTFFFFGRPGRYLTQYYRFFMILNV